MRTQTQNRSRNSHAAAYLATLVALLACSTKLVAATNSITACGTTITTAGTWILANNLSCNNVAIAIETSGVVLKLNGFTISGPGTNGTTDATGITVVSATGAGLKNVTINGPGMITLFTAGILLSGTNTGVVSDITLASNSIGLEVNKDPLAAAPASLLILQNNFQKNLRGIDAPSLNSSTIAGNTFSGNSDGIRLTGISNRLVGNTSSNNGHAGIVLSSNGNTIEANRTESNRFYGVALYSPANNNDLIGNVSFGNGLADILDEGTSCGTNIYFNNLFVHANQTCIK